MPHPPVEDHMEENELVSLFWKRIGKIGYLRRDQVLEKPVHISYSTRGFEKKLLSDALNASKRDTTKKKCKEKE